MELIPTLLFILAVVAVGWAAFWFIDQGIPEPMRMVAKAVVAVVGLLVLLSRLHPGIV